MSLQPFRAVTPEACLEICPGHAFFAYSGQTFSDEKRTPKRVRGVVSFAGRAFSCKSNQHSVIAVILASIGFREYIREKSEKVEATMNPGCTNIRALACVLWMVVLFAASVEAQTVKITALGSHAGEFCRNDRAMLFEDPTGVRLLYDPGRTVDETDTRLGAVHAVLLSSVHPDHIGDVKPNPASPGTCAAPGTVSAAPNSNAANIAAVKSAEVITGGEMGDFLGRKIQNIRGVATPSCQATGLNNETVVPEAAPCIATTRPGGSRTVRFVTANAGVKVANIPAFHSNGIPAG